MECVDHNYNLLDYEGDFNNSLLLFYIRTSSQYTNVQPIK